jgi:two-component system, sensor histidine kinase and response regulator
LPTLVEGGREALAALQQAKELGNSFPLVLTDMQMPQMDGFALAEQINENPLMAGATIMMLTSAGQRGDAARCRELDIAAFLTKPIKQSELREAILAALGNRPKKATGISLVTRHSLREAHYRFRILLAEDNPVNQTLATTLLEKRGHMVVVANNGRQAVEILGKSTSSGFDLVLMDVQMPEMDGFEATAAIREKEKLTGRHIPIVAMTAHALKGDEERCLAVGMDGYISKPIRSEELFRVIENHARTTGLAIDGARAQPVPTETLDAASLLDSVEGDVGLLQELVEVFWGACPRMLSAIRDALESESPEALEKAAHALKGSLGYFGMNTALRATLKLETLGQEGIMDGTAELFAELQEGLSELRPALAALGKEIGG